MLAMLETAAGGGQAEASGRTRSSRIVSLPIISAARARWGQQPPPCGGP